MHPHATNRIIRTSPLSLRSRLFCWSGRISQTNKTILSSRDSELYNFGKDRHVLGKIVNFTMAREGWAVVLSRFIKYVLNTNHDS